MPFAEPFTDSSDDETREETVGDCRGAFDDSDVDVDEPEEPLKHAGVYTAEEVTLITRDKLIQLQSCYAEYLNVLKRRYGRRRAEFRKRIKAEKETTHPMSVDAVTPRQKIKLEQLGAWRRYHRHFGEEGLLHQQSMKRRRLAAGTPNAADGESIHLCNALVNGMDCGEVALPNSSMCAKHILCDGKQVLFFKCEVDECRNVCFPINDTRFCWLHQRLEGIRHDWTAINQATNVPSRQRSSIFSSSAPPLRIFPSSSMGGSLADQASPSTQSLPQRSPTIFPKSPAIFHTAVKRGGGRGRGRRPNAHSKLPAPARATLVQPPLTTAELRNAPPLPTNKTPSIDVSADAGVYGAYMASEQAEGAGPVEEAEAPRRDEDRSAGFPNK